MQTHSSNNASTHTQVDTQEFIASLMREVPTKRRYHSPALYLALWLAGSLAYILLITATFMDIRFDFAIRIKDPLFLSMVAFMFVGAVAFAYSSLLSSLPGNKERMGLFGLGATLAWVGLLIYGMVCDLPSLLNGRVFYHFDMQVFGVLSLSGSLPLLALWLIVRHLAPMQASKVAIAMSLASFMLAATVMRFFYVSLYNGVDCSFNLFFWILIPMLLSSGCGSATMLPLVRSWLPRFRTR